MKETVKDQPYLNSLVSTPKDPWHISSSLLFWAFGATVMALISMSEFPRLSTGVSGCTASWETVLAWLELHGEQHLHMYKCPNCQPFIGGHFSEAVSSLACRFPVCL